MNDKFDAEAGDWREESAGWVKFGSRVSDFGSWVARRRRRGDILGEGVNVCGGFRRPAGTGRFLGRYQPLRSWLSSGCAAGTITFGTGSELDGRF